MKLIKKCFAFVLILTACFALTACSSFDGYDDDAVIINTTSNYVQVGAIETDILGSFSLTVAKFNGVREVRELIEIEEEVELSPDTFNMELGNTTGKIKVVLVKGNTVITIAEWIDGESTMCFDVEECAGGEVCVSDPIEIPAGVYSLRLVGQDARDVIFKFNNNN